MFENKTEKPSPVLVLGSLRFPNSWYIFLKWLLGSQVGSGSEMGLEMNI